MAKRPKDEPEFRYLNHMTFTWNDRWWEADGHMHWWVNMQSLLCAFHHRLVPEFGIMADWVTVKHAEQQIEHCKGRPVFRIDPDPVFLRKWLDTWVETNAIRIWNHVYPTLLKKQSQRDAERRANELKTEFEGLYV